MAPRSSRRRRARRLRATAVVGTRTSMTAPSEIAPAVSLPDDLIFSIFSRLPLKSVCRFRCASRGWHARIADPAFLAAHRSRPAESFFVVSTGFCGEGYGLRLVDMDGSVVKVIKDVSWFESRSTRTSDLICLARARHDFAQVIDPSTGKVLLDWPKQHAGTYDEDEHVHHTFGFGRAVPSGAYKLVRISDFRVCEVLTLGDNVQWRSAQLTPTHVFPNGNSPVVVDGVMYVLATSNDFSGDVLCFDLETEGWQKSIENPRKIVGQKIWEEKTKVVRITELSNTLCLVQSERFDTNIWLLNDSDKSIWIKAHTIPIIFSSRPMPLMVTRDGDRLIFCCASLDRQGQVVQSYDPHNNRRVELPRLGGVDAITIGICSLHLDRFV